jgi:hypothetical protein
MDQFPTQLSMGDHAVSAGIDRAIATLAIAGGVVGLARLLSGLNPQPESEDPDAAEPADAAAATPDATEVLPTPTRHAYIVGLVCVGLAGLLAIAGTSITSPLELLGSDPNATVDVAGQGAPAVIVRFGIVILLAGIVEQIVERAVSPWVLAKENKALVTGAAAVILGVAAALVVHVYLLHNVGFFGVKADTTLKDAITKAPDVHLWFDTFATGLIIAAGTKPLHDLSSRLRKAKAKPKAKVKGAA